MATVVSSKKYKLAVVIGRFQILHVGHQLLLNKAASLADNVLVLLGSCNQPRTIKNPFNKYERAQMVRMHFEEQNFKNCTVKGLTDNLYSDTSWVNQVQTRIQETKNEHGLTDKHVCIVGLNKDESTYYLDLFPQYKLETIEEFKMQLDATSLRNVLFTKPDELKIFGNIIPKHVYKFLEQFKDLEPYPRLVEEYEYYQQYPKDWGKGPFVTADAIIKKSGHIVLIQRGDDPGKDLWALPGGFVELDERIFDGSIREVGEETNLDIPPGLLKGSLTKTNVFDHPKRSLRGRVITHCYLFDLDGKDRKEGLPFIKGSSDAKTASWFPINKVLNMGHLMFEDHLDMVKFMLGLE